MAEHVRAACCHPHPPTALYLSRWTKDRLGPHIDAYPDKEQPERIRFVLVSALEMTEQVQARQEVERLNQLKEDFVSLATHELRTLLTTMLSNAQILEKLIRRQTASLSPQDVERLGLGQELALLEKMTQQASKMNQLIAEMLDTTRMR